MKKTLLSIVALMAFSTATQAQDMYVGGGFPSGVTLGYALPLNAKFGLRTEIGTGFNYDITGNQDGVDVAGGLKSKTAGVYADFFPFEDSSFRLVGGLNFNDIKATLNATGSGSTTINGLPVNMTGEYYNNELKFPTTTPYIGIGWGHNLSAKKGLGFYVDIGAMFGTFDVTTSTSLVANGKVSQADLDAQSNKWKEKLGGINLMPSVAAGVSYRF